jgi:hypothetical protein
MRKLFSIPKGVTDYAVDLLLNVAFRWLRSRRPRKEASPDVPQEHPERRQATPDVRG